jgi:hypothetical protein
MLWQTVGDALHVWRFAPTCGVYRRKVRSCLMIARRLLIGAALMAALLIGGSSAAASGPDSGPAANCVGQHVSEMAREHGGMAAATAHHNDIHGADLSVGEHQAHIRDEMCGR